MVGLLALSLLLVGDPSDQTALHPVLRLDNGVIWKSYQEGRAEAKKKTKFQNLERRFARDVGRVRSPTGQSWTSPYAVFLPPHAVGLFVGYNEQREYVTPERFEKEMIELETNPPAAADRRIRFFANLYAWPGVSEWDSSINRAANPRDVREVRFVLIVDGDEDRPVHPLVRPSPSGEATLDGSVTIPEVHTVQGSSTTTSSARASGSGGWVSAYGTSTTTSTVTYVSHRVMGYEAFNAQYVLEFPLYDKTGRPHVTPASKRLTLKIVRWNGEHSADFNLKDYEFKK